MSSQEPRPDASPARWSASTSRPDLWVDPAEDPRYPGSPETDERSVLLEYLRAYRLIIEMKCADLSPEQLARRSVPPSTMSLLGLLRHLAEVERTWFRRVMAGEDVPELYDKRENRDADWDGAVADPAVVAAAWRDWRAEMAAGDRYLAGAHDLTVAGRTRDGQQVVLRDVLVHLIEEYARHAGHADLLRECIDGRVGQ